MSELTSIRLGKGALFYHDEAEDTVLIMRGNDGEVNEWMNRPSQAHFTRHS